jgi:hypothetical protein
MKSLLITPMVCLLATAAQANDIKFEYNKNDPTSAAVSNSNTFKTEFTKAFNGPVSYQVETVVTQAENKGPVTGQVVGKITTSIPVNNYFTVKPRIEVGQNFATVSKTGQFYGGETKITFNTPVDGLTVSGGYRIRKGFGSVLGQNVNRLEVNTEYNLTKKNVLGLVYYKNTGDTQSNVYGVYTKVKF